jgi:hypothetical protein
LQNLDSQLGDVFDILNKVEASHSRQIVAMLSSDHGFDEEVTNVVHLEDKVLAEDSQIKVLDEGKYMGLNFPSSWNEKRKSSFLSGLALNPNVDIVAYQNGDKLFLQSHNLKSVMVYGSQKVCTENSFSISVPQINPTWMCPDNLDLVTNNLYYPYFISNISHYFKSPNHPEAVIIAKPGVSFNKDYLGQHGGPTPQELFVPLLIHNGQLSPHAPTPPGLWQLLNFM